MSAEADRIAGPNADRWRCDLAEELAVPPAEGTAEGTVAAALADQIVTLVPLAGDREARSQRSPEGAGGDRGGRPPRSQQSPEGPGSAAAHAFADRLREASPVLESARSRIRLTVGVSTPAEGVTALAGALHEAQSARRLAAIRADAGGAAAGGAAAGGAGPVPAVSVVTSDEVASHELLLASVPGSVLRSFRERLLGPLLAYDERHHAELLPTLREFLACSGSWNACAAAMYVHVNTVRYRIRRIEELTGRDLSRLDDQVDFFVALRIR